MNKSLNSSILRSQSNWKNLFFYKKTVVLYDLTYFFTNHFLNPKDRTVDQMIQAARSGKQNIVEGLSDGVTSIEIEIKLLNVARGSIKELQEDYVDYLRIRNKVQWDAKHSRFDDMLHYCKNHNELEDYEPFFSKWNDEEQANVAITICRMVDKMLSSYLKKIEETFVKEGGIRERMSSSRIKYRNKQENEIKNLRIENEELQVQIQTLTEELSSIKNHKS